MLNCLKPKTNITYLLMNVMSTKMLTVSSKSTAYKYIYIMCVYVYERETEFVGEYVICLQFGMLKID